MVSVNRFFLEKLGASDATRFVGNLGEMWYDPITGVLRISDGVTPGGIILGALGSTGYCGSFYDTTTQTNAANTNVMTYNTTDIADGVQIENSSQIKILHTGNYNIQFSAQLDKTDSGDDSIDIWLMKNGGNVTNSSTRLHVNGNNAKLVAAWNWVFSAVAGDYYEIAWYSADPNIRLYTEASASNPTRPGIPSVILTVSQV